MPDHGQSSSDDARWIVEVDESHPSGPVLRIWRAEGGVADSMGPELTSRDEVEEFVSAVRHASVRLPEDRAEP